MRTVMVIDGADNCAYDCFLASEELFGRLFPGAGQDVEFIEDVLAREGEALNGALAAMWRRPVRRTDLRGIDGLLFYGLLHRKRFYPNKRDSDLDWVGRSFGTERPGG